MVDSVSNKIVSCGTSISVDNTCRFQSVPQGISIAAPGGMAAVDHSGTIFVAADTMSDHFTISFDNAMLPLNYKAFSFGISLVDPFRAGSVEITVTLEGGGEIKTTEPLQDGSPTWYGIEVVGNQQPTKTVKIGSGLG